MEEILVLIGYLVLPLLVVGLVVYLALRLAIRHSRNDR
jgi:hypothetical protein